MLFIEPTKRVISRDPAIPIPEFTGARAEPALHMPDSGGHECTSISFHAERGKTRPDALRRGPEGQPGASRKVLMWTIG